MAALFCFIYSTKFVRAVQKSVAFFREGGGGGGGCVCVEVSPSTACCCQKDEKDNTDQTIKIAFKDKINLKRQIIQFTINFPQ